MSKKCTGKNMQILRATADNLAVASQILADGGLVAYPTDTVYGLGCNPFNVKALKRLFKVKGERDKPLPILASDVESIEKIAFLSEKARKIAARFWPGPLTLVLPKKPALLETATCNLNSVGVRIPKHDVALRLIRLSNGLLVGTSANKTGAKPPCTAQEVAEQLREEVDVILDGGTTPLGVSSTVVDFTQQKPKILREGPTCLEEILKV
jgi:L-threonylcarbamoyladenylate synthase